MGRHMESPLIRETLIGAARLLAEPKVAHRIGAKGPTAIDGVPPTSSRNPSSSKGASPETLAAPIRGESRRDHSIATSRALRLN